MIDRVALYVDGALITPDAGQDLTGYATNVFADNLGDGSNTDVGPSVPFETGHGVTDELWIFQGALTATQVNQLRTQNSLGTDTDGDGVTDAADACQATAAGATVDASGCSIADLCPCVNAWKNHGAYVSCVAHASEGFVSAGLITSAQKDAIVSAAAGSTCGSKK